MNSAKSPKHPRRHLCWRTDTVDPSQKRFAFVIRQEGSRHRLVCIETLANCFRPIVRPMLEFGIRGRRTINEMINLSRLFVGPTVDQSLFQERTRNIQLNNRIDPERTCSKQSLESFGLRHSSWKSVEHESIFAIVSINTVVNKSNHGLVRNESTRIHNCTKLRIERPRCLGRTKHVTRRNLRNSKFLAQYLCLRSFARTRRANQNNNHTRVFPLNLPAIAAPEAAQLQVL